MFTLRGYILIIIFVLLLLHLLLLLPPLPLINGIGIAREANQPVFVCHALTGMKTILLTELGLWRRSAAMGWRRARRRGRGLGIRTNAVV